MIVSIDVEKAFDKIQHCFNIKSLKKLGREGMYFNKMKTTYEKPTTNITFNGKSTKLFF